MDEDEDVFSRGVKSAHVLVSMRKASQVKRMSVLRMWIRRLKKVVVRRRMSS